MAAFLVRRLIQGVFILILATLLTFLILNVLPSDPLSVFVAQNRLQNLSPEARAALEHEWGLDKPVYAQYISWLGNILHGDLGYSFIKRQKVSALIGRCLPITLNETVLATLLGSILGIIFGLICAVRRGKWIDNVLTILANLGITVPNFWLGILMMYFFSLKLQWLPIGGYTSPFDDFWMSTRQLIMPVICLSIFILAALTRQTRSSALEVIQQDYIRTAWAKGLSERVVMIRHVLKNSLLPIITLIGLEVPFVVGGSVVIETVFNIPGIGRQIIQAILTTDYVVVVGCILIIVLAVVLVNLLVDILYGWIDPRLRFA